MEAARLWHRDVVWRGREWQVRCYFLDRQVEQEGERASGVWDRPHRRQSWFRVNAKWRQERNRKVNATRTATGTPATAPEYRQLLGPLARLSSRTMHTGQRSRFPTGAMVVMHTS